jgi:hypothetical protein
MSALGQKWTYAAQQNSGYSITSSARNKVAVGNATPIAFAVFRFMANSKFSACSTGRSAGFAPGYHIFGSRIVPLVTRKPAIELNEVTAMIGINRSSGSALI